jgi:hypothetical protein
MRRFVVAIAAVTAALVGGAGPAHAEQVEHYKFANDFSFDNSCVGGPTVAGRYQDQGTVTATRRGPVGLVAYTMTVHATETFTNVATGKALTLRTDLLTKDVRVTDDGHGTLTIIWQTPGVARVADPDGHLIAVSSGTTFFEAILDDGGTPGDPTDDTLISERPTRATGVDNLTSRDYCADIIEFTS